MRTFTEKPKAAQRSTSGNSFVTDQAHTTEASDAKTIFRLQRTIGNHAVQRLFQEKNSDAHGNPASETTPYPHHPGRIPVNLSVATIIQTKLTVNEPGDKFEQEADSIADRVMRMNESTPLSPLIQRKCTECEGEEDKKKNAVPIQRAPAIVAQTAPSAASNLARQSVEGQEEDLFTQSIGFRKAAFAVPQPKDQIIPDIADRLVERQATGQPLPAATREKMENGFAHDFSRVRIHNDAEAGEISRQFSAQAFAHGNHIYFANGKYDPEGSSGKRLLAHELTHVVQQGQAVPRENAQAAAPAEAKIQRVATFAAGTVHEVNNLADSIMNGAAVGFTPPSLNGSIVLSTGATRTALAKPTCAFGSSASGGVDAQVATVPTNTSSFDEKVLAAGPWTINVPKGAVGARFSVLTACTGAGDSAFQAKGKPNDAHMFTANRRHEDHHANDHKTAFNGSIAAWDAKLTAAASAGTKFNGPTEAAAEAALHTAMGGTPDQIADAYFNEAVRLNNVFHATPAGGNVTVETPTSNADCSTSSVQSHNPS
jgi:uncharacterized protein DUF4157